MTREDILMPLEVAALKRSLETVSTEDVGKLIATLELAWSENKRYSDLIKRIWEKFGEMSSLIRQEMKKQ